VGASGFLVFFATLAPAFLARVFLAGGIFYRKDNSASALNANDRPARLTNARTMPRYILAALLARFRINANFLKPVHVI
jgi:hypothetical protein